MCDYKKRLPDKTGVFFCDRVLVFALGINVFIFKQIHTAVTLSLIHI